MVSLSEVRASNIQLTPATIPQVSVFIGATAGIGKAALTKLVSTGFPLRAYIIGRDEAAFQPALRELQASNPSATLIFLEGEISLLAEARRLTDIILSREEETGGGIDMLFLSSGFLPFLGRQETAEGIELSTAVAFYSRQAFIRRLLPLLQARASARRATSGSLSSFRPRIINVLAAGVETTDLFLDDLQLKEPGHFSVPSYARHVATMTSVSLKRLAEEAENDGVVIIHHHPGLVSTELFRKSWGDQWDAKKQHSGPPAPPDMERSTPAEAGERSLYVMTSAKYGGSGVPIGEGQATGLTVQKTRDGSLLCVGDKLETLNVGDVLDSLENDGAADKIWDLTNQLIGEYL
ncbi:short-chain dehydrogenase [Aspergillus flavus]|nr:short-chain dehydrogenase [Aspergillus flavus]